MASAPFQIAPSAVLQRGRFAPSPSGPLHFGSLITALASFLEVRSQGGYWLVRIEDIDTPRVIKGAANDILHTLESYGMEWDGPVLYQSQRIDHYQAALQRLMDNALAYPCTCSRQEIAQMTIAGPAGPIYPGTCRGGMRRPGRPAAIRLRTNKRIITFQDRIQGTFAQCLETAVGDFIIRRADSLFAYQLAVVVDDAAQMITQVVRGCDLLDSTPRQIYLQYLLGLSPHYYSHLPLAVDQHGAKLSKQKSAAPLNRRNPGPTLVAALRFLGQAPPRELARARPTVIWSWALEHWRPEKIPGLRAIDWRSCLAAESSCHRFTPMRRSMII